MAVLNRRQLLQGAAGSALAIGGGAIRPDLAWAASDVPLVPGLPAGLATAAVMDALPGKKSLIKLSYRPPNYETPISYLDSVFTPNDAFFVRYHLSDIPEIDAQSWKLKIGGEAATSPLELTLADLKSQFEPIEIAAVCMCSGNRRGQFQPHVPGVQWGFGATGNAKWKGARLKDVLAKVGLKKEALEIVLDGADGPVLDKTPDYVKSLPVWKALDENVLIAYEMNGAPLPHFNGFPARLIVPGWTATYWIKHLTSLEVVAKPFEGFWVKTAYRIPRDKFAIVQRFTSQQTAANEPITEMVPQSLITNLAEGTKFRIGQPIEIRGVAWDSGYGMQSVAVSTDGGKSWQDAALGADSGRFSFRPWSSRFAPGRGGQYAIMAKATNRLGQGQTSELILNPAGYHNNVMHRVNVAVA